MQDAVVNAASIPKTETPGHSYREPSTINWHGGAEQQESLTIATMEIICAPGYPPDDPQGQLLPPEKDASFRGILAPVTTAWEQLRQARC